ncbi:helix-turn-helix domain-containing protein [Caproicibacterium sp. XB1]|uniref:helix-turn-helix domain-containing protein n=1 Tax=Caproicibacterium sp. XB1 TaxID=3396405 RepID=UPI0039B6F3CA
MYEKFEQLLKERNVTPYRVSKDTGVPQSTLSDWKRGRSVPRTEKLQRIADYFNVSVDYLLGNEQKEKPTQNVQVRDEHDNIVVLDEETRDLIDSLRKKPEMKMLFSVSKGATKEDIIKTIKIIEALKDKGEEGDD